MKSYKTHTELTKSQELRDKADIKIRENISFDPYIVKRDISKTSHLKRRKEEKESFERLCTHHQSVMLRQHTLGQLTHIGLRIAV